MADVLPPVLGIDLAGDGRLSGYGLLAPDATLLDLGFVAADDDILALAANAGVALAGIDAPLSLPEGLCCFDLDCACVAVAPDGVRAAERDLRRAGIGCFTTNKRTIIPGLVRRGMRLAPLFESQGIRPLEVYPYGTKLRLFGRPLPRKSTPAGRAWVAERLASLVRGLPAGDLPHDLADAVLAAYCTLLIAHGQAEALGALDEGQIWIPALSALHR